MPDEQTSLDSLRIDRSREGDETKRTWIPLLVVILLLGVAGGFWLLRGPAVAEVRTAIAREVAASSRTTVLNASGYVTARRQATVSSKVTGKVLEVLIEEGMEVEAGQVMARLDSSNVRAGLILAEAQTEAARAAVKETGVRLAEARLGLDRALALRAGKVSSQAELDRAQAEVDALAARIDRQRREVEVAQRQVALWQRQLEDMVIRSPFAGIIVSKNAQPGEMISPISAGGGFTRTGIGTVVDMTSLEIEVDVNESYINRVSAGQKVIAVLDSYPDWQIPSYVIAIIPTADRQKATVAVRIGFEELDARILPDMGVKVAFQEQGSDGSDRDPGISATLIVIPQSGLRRSAGGASVLVVNDQQIEERSVTVTEGREGDQVFVIGGLRPGERVVVEGPDDLIEGDRVEEIHE